MSEATDGFSAMISALPIQMTQLAMLKSCCLFKTSRPRTFQKWRFKSKAVFLHALAASLSIFCKYFNSSFFLQSLDKFRQPLLSCLTLKEIDNSVVNFIERNCPGRGFFQQFYHVI